MQPYLEIYVQSRNMNKFLVNKFIIKGLKRPEHYENLKKIMMELKFEYKRLTMTG